MPFSLECEQCYLDFVPLEDLLALTLSLLLSLLLGVGELLRLIHTKRERERVSQRLQIQAIPSFTPSVSVSKVYNDFSVCLHVLDLSMWTCFALNKGHALFKDVEAST